ncbi:18113_t:CDS:1 [Funneliformis geosporum]|uniref:18113_t:CDS:1 n=1 Tax=Funneliformis geosporum TaxID=1117311 RepID=A0A9W4T0S2_9GLOM|nr:18113_t:CDS:1 [Funneliformis geosporum]
MLNKIKVIGEFLPPEIKERDNKDGERKEKIIYFNLKVPRPNNNSETILRCLATKQEVVEKIEQGIAEKDIIEVQGYLRNEIKGRQIIINVREINKLNISFEQIDRKNSNYLRLIGKIITNIDSQNDNQGKINFRISVPREVGSQKFSDKSSIPPLYFCVVDEEKVAGILAKVKEQLKEHDIILLEGSLQTKIVVNKIWKDGEEKTEISRPSHIIVQAFTLIDSDLTSNFYSLAGFPRVIGETKLKVIDFTKPREDKKVDNQEKY